MIVIALLALRFILYLVDSAFTGSWIIGSLFGAYGLMFTGRIMVLPTENTLPMEFSTMNLKK